MPRANVFKRYAILEKSGKDYEIHIEHLWSDNCVSERKKEWKREKRKKELSMLAVTGELTCGESGVFEVKWAT